MHVYSIASGKRFLLTAIQPIHLLTYLFISVWNALPPTVSVESYPLLEITLQKVDFSSFSCL